MKLSKVINDSSEFKFYILMLTLHVFAIIIGTVLAIYYNYYIEDINIRIIIYQFLTGVGVCIINSFFICKSKDYKILNLMSFFWLQSFTFGFELTLVGKGFVGVLIVLIGMFLTINFWRKLAIKKIDEYYGEYFFNGFFSILSLFTVTASIVLFFFIGSYYFSILR